MNPRRAAARDEAAPAPRGDWTRHKERGNRFALWFMVSLALVFGRHVARIAAGFAVAWYLVRAFAVRRHVYDFLRRVLTRPPRFRDLVKTYWTFGTVTLDRVFMIAGRDGDFDVRIHGADILDALQARGEGAILLGAHLGNFLALHALGQRRRGLDVHILQYPDQNPMMTNVMTRLDPALAARVIPLGSPDVLVRLGRAVEAGDFAALLADRMGPKDTRGVECEFLGAPAVFPSGGAEAALVLGCPLLVFFGLYRGANRYDLYFERLDEGERPARPERREAAEQLVRRYADRLAHYVRLAPCNWFNFYDYWASEPR